MMSKANKTHPDKDSEEDNDEAEKGKGALLFQKKAMRLLRNDVENIIRTHDEKVGFSAFQIDDESIDKKVIKISFNE